MDDIATLQIRVLSNGLSEANARLSELERRSKGAEKATDNFGKGFGRTMKTVAVSAVAFVTASTAAVGFMKVIQTTREFQVLRANLLTATGDVKRMEQAWSGLTRIAAETPYTLKEVVTSFNKMSAYGLEPSKAAIMSYGDTASAMGKGLQQMIEAVADATTGEFERLKEFGIKSRNEGESIVFTFRGISTRVKNTSKDIQDFLVQLGQENFAGAMARRMATLDGALSNFGDAWENMLFQIGEHGLGDAVEDGIRQATEALQEFTNLIESGVLGARIDSLTVGFGALGRTGSKAFSDLNNYMRQWVDSSSGEAGTWDQYWEDVFNHFPIYLNAAVQTAIAHLQYFVKKSEELGETFKTDWQRIGNWASNSVGDKLFDFMGGDKKTEWEAIKSRQAAEQALSQGYSPLAGGAPSTSAADSWLEEENRRIADQTTELINNAEAHRHRADLLGQIDAELKRLDSVSSGDPLGGVLPEKGALKPGQWYATPEDNQKGKKGGGRRGGGRREKVFSYDDFEDRLPNMDIFGGPNQEVDQLANAEQRLQESYERRRRMILESTKLTEDERAVLLAQADNKYKEQIQRAEQERQRIMLSSTADMFGNLATVMRAFGKKGAKAAKALSIVQTTIKMYESATAAYASAAAIPVIGWAAAPIAAAAAIAAGAANIAAIKSQDDNAGAYEHGGMIPSGKYGLVGEAGPEYIQGPAVVTSARTTADRSRESAPAVNPINVNIHNYAGAQVEQKPSFDGRTLDIIIRAVDDAQAKGISTGTSKTAKSLASTFPKSLKRGQS